MSKNAEGESTYFCARWLFMRAMGAIFFSAFYLWAFQARGLIGPRDILPARAKNQKNVRIPRFPNFGVVV